MWRSRGSRLPDQPPLLHGLPTLVVTTTETWRSVGGARQEGLLRERWEPGPVAKTQEGSGPGSWYLWMVGHTGERWYTPTGRNSYRNDRDSTPMAQIPTVDTVGCHREDRGGGEFVCHYCGSSWNTAMMGYDWDPLSCPRRDIKRFRRAVYNSIKEELGL